MKHFTHTSAAITLLALALGVTACSTDEPYDPECDSYDGVIFVVGVTANQPAPDLNPELACRLEATIAAGNPVGVVTFDGTPHLTLPVRDNTFDAKNPTVAQGMIDDAYNEVVLSIQAATPQGDGSDLAAAVNFAADAATTATTPVHSLVVIDSGVSDSGAGDMTADGVTIAAPKDFAEHLQNEGTFADETLAGFDIELWSMGFTAGDQASLPERQKDSIASLWRAAFVRAGADVETVPYPREGTPPETTFTAGVVEAVAEAHFEPAAGAVFTFGDASDLAFVGNSADFVAKKEAKRELESLAQWLAADPRRSATIIGRTSSAQLDIAAVLSKKRAMNVRDTLVDLGVSANQLTARGDGYTANPPDRDANNRLIPGAAALNRVVVISLEQR